ncbi:DNA-primase RepB domain-containing protein [Bradyrhizobium yuanmingense]|uniref:DNA-primase RepB domain-containing protein n=1 Tax=Bradyrhizobium yuanmingense TaxID=108015 RepID=UPI0023BA390D|nr:DNA-primase RepB domain-containing protein [Bradyrhizobium yuanmingense]MDF0521588.1 DNA-primase RepB domain-containing protein [Bradyrhizobium yuanmingense]
MDAQVQEITGSPDEREAADFLEQLRPGGPWVLTAIIPDGRTDTRTFTTAEIEAMRAFIRKQNATSNIYYSLNPARTHLNKKATKKDIASVDYLHVDADPSADETPAQFKERLAPLIASFGQQPTFVIDSGNGVQLLWRLDAPVSLTSEQDIDDIEARNFALARAFGADPSTRNVDRILRVPGTTNWPNEKKRKAGRTACPATVIDYCDVSYPLSAFPPAAVETKKPKIAKAETPSLGSRKKLPYKMRLMLDATGATPAGHKSRSELVFAFLCEALRKGFDEQQIIALCLDEAYRGKSIFEHISDEGGRKYLEGQIEKALKEPVNAEGKVVIKVTTSNLDEAWRQTERSLIRAKNCEVYVRGGSLVQPLWRFEKSADRNRDTLVASFVRYNVARLRDVVGHHAASFERFDQRSRSYKPVDPPRDVIEALLEAGHWSFPSVKGIVTSPTMRPDGSLLVKPGYDPATQLWYKSAGDISLPPMPERPTKADAKIALAKLTEMLEEFPFAGDKADKAANVDTDKAPNVDKSVALAAILTTVLRGAFEVAPMFFISAPEAGTGKSYLVKVISTIATGREAVPLAGTRNTEEMEKRLSAAAFEALPILSLNNLDHDLDSGLLCQMLTEGKIKIRLFGRNDETRECDCRGTTVLANGNNIRIVGDLVRRTLTCRLDAKVEAPEKREFTFDPVERVRADRGAYLAAAFTIARAYIAAGSPPQANAASIAGFADWRRFVQLPLVWLGQEDPVKSMEDARAMDPTRSALADRMKALLECIGANSDFTAAQVYNKAMETTMAGGGFPKPAYPNLIVVYSRDGRNVNAKSIGNQLVADLGRVSIGHKIELVKKDPKTSHSYRIVASEETQKGRAAPVVPSEETDAARPTTPNEEVKNDDLY